MTYDEILKFWFEELNPDQHYKKDSDLDQMILDRFGPVHAQASAGELYSWRKNPEGSLAEIIILDQLSRNMFRDTPKAFAWDTLALVLSQSAISKEQDKKLSDQQRHYLYMPFMHSESSSIHEVAVELFSQKGLERALEFEIKHKVIIDRFGRYPHRNKILGRSSTEEELEFLKQPNSSF